MQDRVNQSKQPALNDAPFQRILNEMSASHQTRVPLIQQIEERTRHKFIAYIALLQHPNAGINYDDIQPFSALLGSLDGYMGLDLLINSPGGNTDIAEKIIYMVRQFVAPPLQFRLIVANAAKSAATMLAFGADRILMGYCSELGPIDPQVTFPAPGGQYQFFPAQSVLDGFDAIYEEVQKTGNINQAYVPLLATLNPTLLDVCKKAIDRVRAFGESWLPRYMCGNDQQKANRIVNRLLDVSRYLSHGQIIDANEAKDIGLSVDYLEPDDPLWKLIWEYYCRAELFLRTTQQFKLFESLTVSIAIRQSGG